MKDFNIAKYLRENYQGSFSMFQPYVDLNPLKEESEEQLDTEIPYKGPDPHLDGMGSDFEQAKPVEEVVDGDSLIDTLTQEYGEWLDQNNLPQMSADELLYDDSIKKTPEQEKYLQDFINRWDDAQKNYGTDDIEENVGAEQGEFDRTIDLFGQKVVDIANEMIDDGYEKEDAVQFLRDMANYIEDNVI